MQADSLITELSGKPLIQKQNLHPQMSLKHVKTIKAQKTQEEPVTIPTNPSNNVGDLPGGTVGKNLLANAGDMGSITDLGGSQMPRSN